MTTTHAAGDLSTTTTEHPNAARARKAFADFSAGDLDAVRASFAEDATWTSAGSSPLSGTYRGWDEISAMFGTLMERTGGSLTMELNSVLGDDAHAVAVYDSTSTVAGRTETQRCVLVDEMTPDGKVKASHWMAFDQAAADAHMSG